MFWQRATLWWTLAEFMTKPNIVSTTIRGFDVTLDAEHKTKLSSAGLVYKHFGREIIQNVCKCDTKVAEILFFKIYETFIEAIDAIDNGINQYDVAPEKKRYRISTDLSSRVSYLNPAWNQGDGVDIMEQFKKAMALTGSEFMDRLMYYYE
eukprot:20242_1